MVVQLPQGPAPERWALAPPAPRPRRSPSAASLSPTAVAAISATKLTQSPVLAPSLRVHRIPRCFRAGITALGQWPAQAPGDCLWAQSCACTGPQSQFRSTIWLHLKKTKFKSKVISRQGNSASNQSWGPCQLTMLRSCSGQPESQLCLWAKLPRNT